MKTIFSIILTLLIISCSFGQKINLELKKELDVILKKDQTLRELFENNTSIERKSEILKEFSIDEKYFQKKGWSIVNYQDSLNLIKVERIIKEYGYPGKSIVGEPTNKTVWFVIQHSNKIEKYLPIIKQAGELGEIKMTLVAMMEDRMLMYKGKEQIYGTQGSGRHVKNPDTGEDEFFNFIWPIKNPEKVNKLRMSVGFTSTIEEYSKKLDIEYKVYSLEEINIITSRE